MTQKKRFLKTAGYGLMVGTLALSVPSCIDQLYDLSNGISMDMVLGGDSLSIPIGSTDTIRLGDYLTSETLTMLKTMEDGGYGIVIKDSIEPTTIDIDQTQLKIDDQSITKTVSVDFGNINLDEFKIPGIQTDPVNVNLNLGAYSLGNFAIPSIEGGSSAEAGMSDYALTTPSIPNKTVNANSENMLTGITLPSDPGGDPVLLPIVDPAPVSVNASGDIDYSVSVPSGVSNISDIELTDGAILRVSIELSGATTTLNSGAIVPDFDIDPQDLFVFETPPTGGIISFEEKDSLTMANSYKVSKSLNLTGLNISGDPVGGKLDISKTITAIGTMALKNATVMSNKIAGVDDMDLLVTLSVENVVISSMEFDIPTLSAPIPANSVSLNISNSIPEQINKLNKVYFNDPATITINMNTANLPTMESSTIKIESLSLSFPEQFVFEPMDGLSNNVYTISNETFNPTAGKTIQLTLKELDMNNVPVNAGMLTWNGTISYNGRITFNGRINSKNIPSSGNDAKMNVNFTSSTTFKSAEVTTNQISVNMASMNVPINLDIEIAEQVKRLNTLVMEPNTKIRVDLVKPSLPLTFSANNIVIAFPELFIFNPPLPGNNLVLNNALPDSIILILDKLAVNSDLVNGKLVLNNNITVSGGVDLLSGVVSSTDIESLSGKTMSIQASTGDLGISSTTVLLNELTTSFTDSTYIDVDEDGIPTRLVSLDSILLRDNATIELSVNIENMPTLSNPLNADVKVDFPDMFLFEPNPAIIGNRLVIKEPFVDGKLTKTLRIRGMKFDKSPLNGKLQLHEKLIYTAGVSVASSTVNSDDLKGKEISVTVNADIKNIAFRYVYGQLDTELEPTNETMELGEIPEYLQGDDIVLDLTKPVITLNTECNLGLPINAVVKVTPLVGSAENTSVEQLFTLSIPKSDSPDIHRKTNFWIAPDSAGMPTGYRFLPTNIQDLFKSIPDGIKLHAEIEADQSVQHFFDLDAIYEFKLGYQVTIPFAFGEDLNIVIKQPIENIDPSIGEMAAKTKSITVLGSILNSIPLELNLALIPLDEDGVRIPIDTVTQIINAGAIDGSAVASDLDLKLVDPEGLLKDLRAFQLIFTASSNSTVAGAPIKPDNFVKADLKVRIVGGVNISSFLDN
jgi:hypothetical protein